MPKFLFIRFSSIGDIVLTTPVLRCCKEQLKGAEIHFVTREPFRAVIAGNPYVDKVHTFRDHISEVGDALRKEHFDHVVDLHKNLRSYVLKKRLGRPSSTFSKLNKEKWLLVNFKYDRLPRVHIVERYMEAVTGLGMKLDGKGLEYYIPEKEVVAPGSLGLEGKGYIAFVVGAAHATKRLPVEKMVAIIRQLGRPVVLLGGEGDRSVAEEVCQGVGEQVINACGRYSINGSASLVRQADLVLTHDTGLMHIAAAFRKPVLSFWGNTVPEFGMYPYMPGDEDRSVIMGVEGLSCRPCSKIGYEKCPRGHFRCMEDIDVGKVVGEACRLLATFSTGSPSGKAP